MTTIPQQPTGKSRSLTEAFEKYKSTGNNEFFELKDHGDTAIVRFLYRSIEELDWFVVHQVEIAGKKRWVECTEQSDCVGCAKTAKPQLKLFIQLIQKGKEDVVMTFERGQKFIPKMQDLFANFGDLTQHIFEIQREGAKGDSNTDYKINHISASAVDPEQLLERQVFLGTDGFIMQKTNEEMREILSGNFQYQKVENPTPRNLQPSGAPKKDIEVF